MRHLVKAVQFARNDGLCSGLNYTIESRRVDCFPCVRALYIRAVFQVLALLASQALDAAKGADDDLRPASRVRGDRVAGFGGIGFHGVERLVMEVQKGQRLWAVSLGGILFALADEIGEFFAEGVCQLLQRVERRNCDAAFNFSEIAAVQGRQSGERFLERPRCSRAARSTFPNLIARADIAVVSRPGHLTSTCYSRQNRYESTRRLLMHDLFTPRDHLTEDIAHL